MQCRPDTELAEALSLIPGLRAERKAAEHRAPAPVLLGEDEKLRGEKPVLRKDENGESK